MSVYDTSSPTEASGIGENRQVQTESSPIVPRKRWAFQPAGLWRGLRAWSGFLLFCSILLMSYLVGTLVVAPMMVRAAGLRTTGFWAAPAIEPYVPRVRDPHVPETNLQIAPVKASGARPAGPMYTLGANGEVLEKPKKKRKRRRNRTSQAQVRTQQQEQPSTPKIDTEEHYSGRHQEDTSGDGNGNGETGGGDGDGGNNQ